MRFLFFLLCSAFCLFACHSESRPSDGVKTQVRADSIVKFISLVFEVDGKPCKAAINQDYKNFSEKKDFPMSLFITINTLEKDSVGHPTDKEGAVFTALEDEILSQLGAGIKYCYAGRTMMDGYRDMIFYIPSKDRQKTSSILKSIQQKHSRLKAYVFENDPQWEAVAEFYNAIKNF